MCLSDEWFDRFEEREQQRDLNGVSVKEAEDALDHLYSTRQPIAWEMASWIYHHWSMAEVMRMSAASIEIYFVLLVQLRHELGISKKKVRIIKSFSDA